MHDSMEEGIQIVRNKSYSLVSQYINIAIAVVFVTVGFQLIQHSEMASFFQLLLPVPIVFIALRYSSLWSGMITMVLATGIITLVSGYQLGLSFLVGIGIAALIFAICFLRNFSATVAVSSVTLYYIVVLVIAFLYMQRGTTLETYVQGLMAIFKEQLAPIYTGKDATWQDLEPQFKAVVHVLVTTSPLISSLSLSTIMYVVVRTLLKIWKIPVISLGRFQDWEVSDYFVWIFILGGILYQIEPTKVVGINIILGFVLLYYLQGCAIIMFFLKRKPSARFMQILAYVLLFFQIPYIFGGLGIVLTGHSQGGVFLSLPAIILVAGIGLANVWIKFRRRVEQQVEK
jgi:hypothetical protein